MWRDLARTGRGYDLIHATPSPFYSLIYPAYLAARFWRKPFAVTPFVHTGTPRGDSQMAMHTGADQLAVLKKSDLVIVQSSVERKALIEKGVPECKVNVLGMGVNSDDVSGGDSRRFRSKYKIAEKEKIIAYVGALIRDKGAFHLLDAVARIEEPSPVRLVMAGHASVEFKKHLSEKPKRIRECCVLMGNVGGRDKIDLFEACDVLALPSRADSYGIVFLEAWLAGKPVIGAYAGGIPEVISDGEDGFLVPFGDVHMLSECLFHLLNDPELRRRMGRKGRKKVLKSCTWDLRYQKARRWFEDLAGHR
jgi:glycosyltransferase involved in cell wall biosynthesis